MGINLEIWSVMIGLMELGCAMTWNHEEQFVEGDFPFYPYTNRIYAYADTDGLTDSRMRSNEFSGLKLALNRRNFQEKRKSLYAFNKDSNKLIDASKLDPDAPGSLESAQFNKPYLSGRERLNSAESTNTDAHRSEDSYSAERKLKSGKSSPVRAQTPNAANSEKIDRLTSSNNSEVESKLLSRNHNKATELENDKSTVSSNTVFKKNGRSPETLELAQSKKVNSSGLERVTSAEANNVDSGRSKKQNLDEHELKSTYSDKEKLNSADGTKKVDLTGGSEKPKLETKMISRNYKKAEKKYEKSRITCLTVKDQGDRYRRNSLLDTNLARYRSFGESNSQELWAHGISRAMPTTGRPGRKFAREDKPNEKSRKLTLVAPYETNFTGGGFRSVNPSSWLAKEIERFIRRKDHRWLDFMKNTGMDVKKYSGVVSDTKQKSEKTKTKKISCVNCLHPTSAPTGLDDPAKLKTDLLINRIDSLLADLNQFRSNVKNGWSEINSIKKSRDAETSQKLMNDDIMDRRKHRLRRGIRLSKFSALRPPARPAAASNLVENDLRDLRKNVVLYQNRLPQEAMQALEDMKLHIKVYVEKEKDREKVDHQTSGSEMDYYESYPQQIHFKQ